MNGAIPWRRVLIEGAVIVASILLALGADALWQEHVDRGEERVVLEALRDEFEGNQAALEAQADSIAAAIALLQTILPLSASELAATLEARNDSSVSMAIRRPWTVEFRVGALESTLGTQRVSLIRNHRLVADLTQYQSVRDELGEVGDLVTEITVDAYIASNQLPARHQDLVALLTAKVGYWEGYLAYLGRLIDQTEEIAAQLDAETR